MHALRTRALTLTALIGVAFVVALAGAGASGAVGRYTDPAGDAGAAADVTGVSVASDPSGQIVFTISTGSSPAEGQRYLLLSLDTDLNQATGMPDSLGADYLFGVDEEGYGFARWTGSDWDWDTPYSTARVFVSSRGATFSVNRSELGGTQSLNFWVRSAHDTQIGEDIVDDAPDDGGFNYTLAAGGPDIREVAVKTTPDAGPRAGRPFVVKPAGLMLPPSGAMLALQPEPESYSCSAKLAGKPLRGKGVGRCTYAIPKQAKGKRVSIVLTVSYQGATKVVPLEYRVR